MKNSRYNCGDRACDRPGNGERDDCGGGNSANRSKETARRERNTGDVSERISVVLAGLFNRSAADEWDHSVLLLRRGYLFAGDTFRRRCPRQRERCRGTDAFQNNAEWEQQDFPLIGARETSIFAVEKRNIRICRGIFTLPATRCPRLRRQNIYSF